jgi:hypothetical protein
MGKNELSIWGDLGLLFPHRRLTISRRLSQHGLSTNIVSFNVGVEIGQGVALAAILIALTYWRTRRGFLAHAFATNTASKTSGFVLMGYQLTGFFLQ